MKYLFFTLLLFMSFARSAYAQTTHSKKCDFINVRVWDYNANSADTLILMYYKDPLNNVPSQNGNYQEIKSTMDEDSIYNFKFPFEKESGRFFIGRKVRPSDSVYKIPPALKFLPLTSLYLPETGDNILINTTEYLNPNLGFDCHLNFSGKGFEKYSIQESLRKLTTKSNLPPPFDDKFNFITENSYSTRLKQSLSYLYKYRRQLTRNSYQIIKADIYSRNPPIYDGDVQYLESLLTKYDSAILLNLRTKFIHEYNTYVAGISNHNIPLSYFLKSAPFARFVINKIENCDFVVNGISKTELYDYLKLRFKGELRDQLLATYFLYKPSGGLIDITKLPDAIATIKSSYCRKQLLTVDREISSQTINDFSLPDESGKIISMNDFKGKAVLVDFWFTGCGACTHLYKETLSKVEKFYQSNPNIVFISISIDGNKDAWHKSISSNLYTSPTAINLYTMGQGSRHTVIKHYNVSSYPTVLLFNKKHRLVNYNKPDLSQESALTTQIAEALKQ